MESHFRAGIEVGCRAHRLEISGPDRAILDGSMSPTPARRRARRTADGKAWCLGTPTECQKGRRDPGTFEDEPSATSSGEVPRPR